MSLYLLAGWLNFWRRCKVQLLLAALVFTLTLVGADADVESASAFLGDDSVPSSSSSSGTLDAETCPGIFVADCSDAGCTGYGASECPATCVFSTTLRQCVGTRSCLLFSCSGHGLCQRANSSTYFCSCDADYYGDDCSTHCSVISCAAAYDAPDAVCAANGKCQCAGHFTSLSSGCSLCQDGWYGPTCESQCDCGGHGVCHRVTGVCACFQDSVGGYWGGLNCTHCDLTHTGPCCRDTIASFTAPRNNVLNVHLGDATLATGDATMLLWISADALIVARGSVIVSGVVNATGTESVSFQPTSQVQRMPQAVRDTLLCDNGTIAVLTTGLARTDHSYSEEGDGIALEVSVVHGTIEPESDGYTFTVVAKTALFPSGDFAEDVEVYVVSAALSASHGWAVLLSTGSLVVQHRLPIVFTLPPAFTASSLHMDETNDIVLVTGSLDGTWSVLAVRCSEDGSDLVALPITWDTVDAVSSVSQLGRVWQVTVSPTGAIALAGTSTGTVWAAVGNITDLADVRSAKLSIHALAEAPVPGEPEVLALYGVGDVDAAAAATLLCFVQSEETVMTLVWTFDSAGEEVQATLRNAQDFTDAVELAVPTTMTYTPTSGLLSLSQSSDEGVRVRFFTGYGVTAVSPAIVDSAGGTRIAVEGVLLLSGMDCVFDGVRVSSTFLNSSALLCPLPPSLPTDVCASVQLELAMPSSPIPAITGEGFTVQRRATPLLHSVEGPNTTGPYAAVSARLPITVSGEGFVNTTGLRCAFADKDTLRVTSATFVSSRVVTCAFPGGTLSPTKGSTGTIAVSLDGFVYSTALPFTFIGAATRLSVRAAMSDISVASAAVVALPLITIDVVDEEGHPLLEEDIWNGTSSAAERVVELSVPWYNSTRKEVTGPILPSSILVVLAYSNKTVNGSTDFHALLQYPLVGVGQLRFTSPGLESATMTFSTTEGEPSSMKVAVQPTPLLNSRYASESRQPVVVFMDVAGNVVGDRDALLRRTSGVVKAIYFNGSAMETVPSLTVSASGYFNFTTVSPRGLFGQIYTITFVAESFANVSSDPMAVAHCFADEYGEYGTGICHACPAHAICNGSYELNLTDGFWKGSARAYNLYTCPRPRVCLASGCTNGYTGVLCSVCVDGYGKTGTECVKCFSTAVNVVLVALLVIFVLAAPFALLLLSLQVFGPRSKVVHGVLAVLHLAQLVGLVLIPLWELPDFVHRFVVFMQLISTGNVLRLSPFSCLFPHFNADTRFVVQFSGVVIIAVAEVLLVVYTDVSLARKAAELRRLRWLRKVLAPFDSEEAYHNRLTELGLDEDRALETADAAETLDPKHRRIEEAYELLDKNRYAFSAVTLLPSSNVKELALRMLLTEQLKLQRSLTGYEADISRGDAQSALESPPSTASDVTSATASLTSYVVSEGLNVGPSKVVRRNSEEHGSETGCIRRGAAGEVDMVSRKQRGPPSLSTSISEVEGTSGDASSENESVEDEEAKDEGAVALHTSTEAATEATTAAAAASRRFDGVTATPFELFGDQEGFHPASTALHLLRPQVAPSASQPALQEDGVLILPPFLWPPFRTRAIVLCLTVYDYFYIPVVECCFELVRCQGIVVAVTGGADLFTPRMPSSVTTDFSLAADHSVRCDTARSDSYRVAAIVLGSVYCAAVPLMVLWLVLWRPNGGFAGDLRKCCIAVFGVRETTLWWAAVPKAFMLLLVLFHTLVGTTHLAALLICWAVLTKLMVLMYLHPFYTSLLQSLEVLSYVTLSVVTALQLVPFAYFATVFDGIQNIPIVVSSVQMACGALDVAVSCLALTSLGFVVWAVTLSRTPWPTLTTVLDTLGGGTKLTNVLHLLHLRTTLDGVVERFSFHRYNMRVVQEADGAGAVTADTPEDGGLTTQVVQAVRGRAATRTQGHRSSLWTNWGMLGGLIGMESHVQLLSRFMAENVTEVREEEALGAEERRLESHPAAVMSEEADAEAEALGDNVRHLDRFVRQMEKALERRTED